MCSVSNFSNVWEVRSDVIDFLNKHFSDELTRVAPISIPLSSDESYSTYLGFRLDTLRLPSKHLAVLLGICPVVQSQSSSFSEAIAKVRNESKIRDTWRALSQMEWIQFQASDRAHAKEREWVGAWKKALQNELQEVIR